MGFSYQIIQEKNADRLAKVLTPEKNHVTSNLIKRKSLWQATG